MSTPLYPHAELAATDNQHPFRCEDEEQAAVFEWAALSQARLPELRLLFASANGGYRPYVSGARLKRMGVRAGIPDLCLPVPRDPYHGLWVELKVGKNTPTPEQLRWMNELNGQGYCAVVCYGADEAMRVIEAYLTGQPW